MKGRIPFTFLFHGLFKNKSYGKITPNDITNLFTKKAIPYYNTDNQIIASATVQPLSTPFPYSVKPTINQFTFIETTDAEELKNITPEANWFFVEAVVVMRVDSEGSAEMNPINVSWRDRIMTNASDSSTDFLFSPYDPWTKKRYDPRNSITAIRGRNTDFLNKPMYQSRMYPIGSPGSGLDQRGQIVPASIPDPEKNLYKYYPGYIFISKPNTYRLTEEKSMKSLMLGFRPYFLLNTVTTQSTIPAKHNHYRAKSKLSIVEEGITNTPIPAANNVIGVTNGLSLNNYHTYDYSWVTAWQERTENIALFEIEGTPLMRYQYELPFIQIESPGRWLDEYSLSRANMITSLEKIRALTQIFETVKDVAEIAILFKTGGVIGAVNITKSMMDIGSDLNEYTKLLLLREARKKDMAKVTSNQVLDTHYNIGNHINKTTNSYINMHINYPQARLVGGEDNDMRNDESNSEVIVPVNKLFKSLDDFSSYLKANKLTDVANVYYQPFFGGNNPKWDLLKRYGFRRTEQRAITTGRNQTDLIPRVGGQYPGTNWK